MAAYELVKLAAPADPPTGAVRSVAYSPNGSYLASFCTVTPFIHVYSVNSSTGVLTKLTQPTLLPPSPLSAGSRAISFSPDGTQLALTYPNNSPYLHVYDVSGTSVSKRTLSIATPPPAGGVCLAYSPSGGHVVIGHQNTPFMSIYSISGSTYTKLANPSLLPASAVVDATYSPDGALLAVLHSGATPYLTVYSVSGTTYTKLTNPATLPSAGATGLAFSPDGATLAITYSVAPYVMFYAVSGTTLTAFTVTAVGTINDGDRVRYSPDGTKLVVAHVSSPYFATWSVAGSAYVGQLDPPVPTGVVSGLAFSPDSQFLTVGCNTTPFLVTYRVGALDSAPTPAFLWG
jgi:WD40 repeat protein